MQRRVRIPIDGFRVNAMAFLVSREISIYIDLVRHQRILALLMRLAQQVGFQNGWRNEPVLIKINLLDSRIDHGRWPVGLADNAPVARDNLIVVDSLDLD